MAYLGSLLQPEGDEGSLSPEIKEGLAVSKLKLTMELTFLTLPNDSSQNDDDKTEDRPVFSESENEDDKDKDKAESSEKSPKSGTAKTYDLKHFGFAMGIYLKQFFYDDDILTIFNFAG